MQGFYALSLAPNAEATQGGSTMPYTTTCPNKGRCACPEHADGLMRYAPNKDAYQAALRAIQPTRLHIVTPGPPPLEPECDGGYLCTCTDCQRERTRPAKSTARQPWQTRPARLRAA